MLPTLKALLARAPVLLALVAFQAIAGSIAEISIEKYQFTPAEIEIKVGDSIKWTNHEKRTSHSIYFSAEGLAESERLFPGESWERKFLKPGIYPYHCGPHPEMQGVIHVVE